MPTPRHSSKFISCGNSSVGVGHTSKTSTPYGHQLDGNEIFNAPVSCCYIVKWRNRKLAIMGLVKLSNLITGK